MNEQGKIKIMHFVHSLNEGGIERLLLELCLKINKNKFDIQVCCLAEKGIIASEFEEAGIRLHFVNARRDFNVVNIIPNIFVLIKIIKLLRKEKIDITHGHEFFSTVFSRIAAVPAGIRKKYITLHNSYYWWGKRVHKAQKLLSGITTKIICNSKATLQYSLEHDKISRDKYVMIYNGIDCKKFSPQNFGRKKFLDEFNISENKFICMTVGSISPRKGLEYLVKAVAELQKDFPDNIYILAGGKHLQEHSEYDKIIQLISELNLKEKIIITGSRNDISEILNHCDLYLMPSVVEGFGLALAEAMAEEKICIASDIAPFKEIITDNTNGFLFKAGDEEDLAEKIRQVCSMDKNILDMVRRNARNTVVNKFNSGTMVSEYEKLYYE